MLSRYRPRVTTILRALIHDLGPLDRVLDFGAGDGQYACTISRLSSIRSLSAVDVVRRKLSHFPVKLYDGVRLPYEDQSFDLIYAVDALHHCKDPISAIRELQRCTYQFVLLKDHVCWTKADRRILTILDEIGNRRFGIPSPNNYQQAWNWIETFDSAGFKMIRLIHPAACEWGPIGWAANRLQFFALFAVK